MKKALVPLVVAGLLWGCASNSANDDPVQIVPTRDGNADYLAMFLNKQTLLYNGDVWADREHIITSRLKNMGCRKPRMLRERAEQADGTWAFGRQRIVYYSEWECEE
ncbi:MAG TPA: hypothetical protein VMA53_03485 [Stellaceae bacterium]|nr:hypothetical protein [Stellaceae bacterium]